MVGEGVGPELGDEPGLSEGEADGVGRCGLGPGAWASAGRLTVVKGRSYFIVYH